MKVHYIYRLIFPNGKIYVGQTSNLKLRMQDHRYLSVSGKGKRPLHNAIRKYDWDSVKSETLIICNSTQVDQYETAIISLYKSNTIICGYNLESGGNLNKVHSQNTKDLIRDKATGRRTITGKKVVQYDLDGNFVNTWDAAKYADEFYGYVITTVAKACRRSANRKLCEQRTSTRKPNKKATSSNYRWEYV